MAGRIGPGRIGTQIWMLKNLDVTTFRNGDSIPQVTSGATWASTTSPAWCYYDNNSANGDIYGKIYNGYAVADSRGLAPIGWHIPTNDEWTILVNFLGGDSVAGGALKQTGTTLWTPSNVGATNSSGFAALPGGYRDGSSGTFFNINARAHFRNSTNASTFGGWRFIAGGSTAVADLTGAFGATVGAYVRIVKD